MKELSLKSEALITEVLNARNRREDFVLIVKGRQAGWLAHHVQYYERYRDAYRKRQPGRRWKLLSFAWRGMLSGEFWAVCMLADTKAKRTIFKFNEGALRAEFYF